jgi:hypothetical protein
VPEDLSGIESVLVVGAIVVAVVVIAVGLLALTGRGSARNRQPGARDVLVVAAAAVAIVLLAAGLTAFLPRDGQAVVFHTPLLIAVLVGGTAFVLWRILRSPRT